MNDKSVVVIISDLHMGGGLEDPGDDHVFDENQFINFMQKLTNIPQGKGDIELFINGDFLEFAQTEQSTYGIKSRNAWCSEPESLEKLNSIIKGHSNIFDAMKKFQETGNKITIAAGNHDVDLYWSAVQNRLKEVAGNVDFAVGEDWYSRFNGRLRIAHGHQYDPANKFKNWHAPYASNSPDGAKRLEMCPGTFFMVRFLNKLENDYPFADNIKPLSALIGLLLKERPLGSLPYIWMIIWHLAHDQSLGDVLNIEEMGDWPEAFPEQVVSLMQSDAKFGKSMSDWYRKYIYSNANIDDIEYQLQNGENLYTLLMAIAVNEDPEVWDNAMSQITGGGQVLGTEEGTLSLGRSLFMDERKRFGQIAEEVLSESNAQVVVMGHTHEPDEQIFPGEGIYLNPGSWTRYAKKSDFSNFTMDNLRDESKYPYELNYIWVESAGDKLNARLDTYMKFPV